MNNIDKGTKTQFPNTILSIVAIIIAFLFAAIPFFVLSGPNTISEISLYFKDPVGIIWQQTENKQLFIGFYSQLGSMLWLSGAAFCGLTTIFTWRYAHQDKWLMGFIMLFGIILGLDDLFLFHDRISTELFGFGERQLLIFYALFAIFIGIKFGRRIWAYDKIFVCVVIFLGISAVVDTNIVADITKPIVGDNIQRYIEDAPKFVGVLSYWIGSLSLSYQIIISLISSQE